MKRYLFYTIFLTAFCVGCNKNGKVDRSESVAASDAKRIDTIFLDYRFGMTPKEFESHTHDLINKNELDKQGYYHFETEPIKSHTRLHPEYHNNKLFQLNLYTEADSGEFASSELLYLKVITPYVKKYNFIKPVEGLDAREYTSANLGIYMMDAGAATIVSYKDLEITNLLDKRNDSIRDIQEQKTNKQI